MFAPAYMGRKRRAQPHDCFEIGPNHKLWVPHISLVFREMWDTAALDRPFFDLKILKEDRGIATPLTPQLKLVMQQTWDASLYAGNGRFVALLAESLVEALDPQPGERILDLGCGDGFLTRRIAASGATVVGVDSSPQMVAAAKERGADARVASGESLSFDQEFDAVFSNAALHWMSDHDAVLRGVYRALKPGGRFVAECGGQGNIAAIRVALLAVLTAHRIPAERIENNRFFSPADYRTRLEKQGFRVQEITLTPRPTPLASGITAWLETFRSSVLELLPDQERSEAVDQIVALLKPVLCDSEGHWTADYVRLRFLATRP